MPKVFVAPGSSSVSSNWGSQAAVPKKLLRTRIAVRSSTSPRKSYALFIKRTVSSSEIRRSGSLRRREREGKAESRSRTIEAPEAVSFAIRRLSEREAVFDHFQVARDALHYAQGHLRLKDVEAEIAHRRVLREQDLGPNRDLLAVSHVREHAPGARYTTPQMVAMERLAIETIRSGIGTSRPIAPGLTKEEIRLAKTQDRHWLNDAQRWAVWNVLTTEDRVLGLQGVAGSGKTASLQVIRHKAESQGFETRGLAPTSGATKALREAGVESETLQRHLRSKPLEQEKPRLYFLDESSLSSTKQVHDFLLRLRRDDRVLLIGDTRQHQSIEAGRIFHQLQLAGMTTHQLNHIVRQRQQPELLAAIRHLAQGNVKEALTLFEQQGRVHEVRHRKERFAAIARDYARAPSETLVVSADNRSREELNDAIRRELRSSSSLGPDRYTGNTLTARQDLTREDLKVAASYQVGDIVRYGRSNKTIGLNKGDYATVLSRDTSSNRVSVERQRDGQVLSYDPARVSSGQLFQQKERSFAEGDRIQLTSSWKEKGLANRQLGTIERVDETGNLVLRMDDRRRVSWNLRTMPHVDYGYTMTSYSSQGATVNRVLVQVDTGDSRVRALNDKTMAYVASSRGRHDLQIYTDRQADLESTLNRLTLKTTALSLDQVGQYQHRPEQNASLSSEKQRMKEKERGADAAFAIGVA